MAAAFGFELGDLASAIGNDERFVPLLDQIFADFKRSAFDAAAIEFWEDLDDFHVGCGMQYAGYISHRLIWLKCQRMSSAASKVSIKFKYGSILHLVKFSVKSMLWSMDY